MADDWTYSTQPVPKQPSKDESWSYSEAPVVGSMADQSGTEARFWDEATVNPKRLAPQDEEELRKFYQTQPSADTINSWWLKKGFGGLANALEVEKALRQGEAVQGVNYGAADNPVIAGNDVADAVLDDMAESDAEFSKLPVEEQERIKQANLIASANAPVASAPPVEGFWESVGTKASEAFSEAGETLTGAFKRNADEAGEEQSIRSWIQQNGGTPEEAEIVLEQARNNRARMIQEERASRGRYWNDQDARSERWGLTNFARDILAEAIGDPIGTFIPQGGAATRAGRILEAGALNTGIDAAVQTDEMRQGIQQNFDPSRSLLNFGAGGLVQGGLELPGAALDAFRTPEISATPQSNVPPVEGEPGLPGPVGVEGEQGTPGPRFDPNKEAIAADVVVDRVNDIAKDWKNSPQIEVVNNIDEIADPVVRGSIDDPTNTLGFLGEDGKVHIIAGNLKSEAEIPAILFHEALGHHGLAQKFGTELDNLLTRMYESGGKFKNDVDEFLDSRPDYASAYADDPNPKARIVEEILAGRSESGIAVPPNILAKMKHYLKELGRKMGLNIKFNDLEVSTILGMAHDATINGKATASSNGFRYSMKGYKFTKDTVVDDRFKREDTLLRRKVKSKNAEKSYEQWKWEWEQSEREAGTNNTVEQIRLQDGTTAEILIDKDGNWRDVISHKGPSGSELPANIKPTVQDIMSGDYPMLGRTEQFEDLSGRGREGPVVQTYTTEELKQRLKTGSDNRYMKKPFFANNNRPQAPKTPDGKASDTEWSQYYLDSEKYYLTKAREAEDNGKSTRAKDYRHRAKLDRKSASRRDPELAGEMSASDRAKYFREEAIYYDEKMKQRAGRGDSKGVERYRMFRDEAAKKASELATVSLKYMKRQAGPGSEGTSSDMSRRAADEAETPYTGMGKIRTNRPDVPTILEEAAPTRDQESWDEWIDASKQVRKSAEKHAKDLKKGVGSEPADVIAARVGSLNLANRISDLSRKIGQGMGTEHDKYTLTQEMVKLAALEDAIAGVVGNAARIQNSMKIEVASDTATNRAIRYMAKNLGSLEDAEGIAQRIMRLDNEGPDAVRQLAKDALKPLPEDYVTSFRYTAMLSGLGTPTKAIVGTMSNMLFENTKDAIAVGLGGLKRPFTDAERLTAREWGARNIAMVKSIVEATKAAGKSYVAGQAVNAPDRLDIGHASLPGSMVTEYPKRTLAAIDGFFREIIRSGEINGLAVRQALKEGIEPDTPEWNARIDELITNPTKEMKDIATKKADLQQLLDNDSRILRGMETLTRRTTDMNAVDRTIRFAVQNIFPFSRNIDNIMRQTLRNSPIGFLSKNVQADLKAGGARRDQALSRIIVGSTLLYFAGEYAANGLATGQGDSNLDMEALNMAAGRPANSVKIGDEWVSLEGFDAISAPFNAAASARVAWDKGEIDDKTYLTRMLKATGAISSSLYDTTIIEQLDKFTGLFDKRNQNTELGVSLPASFVPAALRQYAQWGDDRSSLDTRGDKSFGDRTIGRTLSGLPKSVRTWIAEKLDFGELPQKMDVFGRGVRREGDPLAAATGIGRGTMEDTDPGVQEVLRLSEEFGKALVTKTEDSFTVDGEKIELSPTERQQWQYLAGQLILEEINGALKDPVWPTLSDEEKADEIKLIVKDSKRDVKEEIFSNYLEPEEEEGVNDGFIYE